MPIATPTATSTVEPASASAIEPASGPTGDPALARAGRLPRPPVGQRRGLGVEAGRVALWQAAAVGAIVAGGPFDAVGGTATGLATLVVAGTALRVRGRWLPDWALVRQRYQRRSRQPQPALPTLSTRTYADRAGNRAGLAGDGRSWSALLQVDPSGDLDDLLRHLSASYSDPELPLTGLQLVDWASPVTGQTARWLALRVDPRHAARAVEARGGGDQGLIRTVGTAALQIATVLRAAGHPVVLPDGTRLPDAWAASLGVDPRQAAEPTTENWRYWSLGMLHQVCYRPRRTPRDWAEVAHLLRRHGSAPALVSAVSIRLDRQRGGGTRTSALVRLGVPAGPTPEAVAEVVGRATAGFGKGFVPLHGTHAVAAWDTLPLAGLRLYPQAGRQPHSPAGAQATSPAGFHPHPPAGAQVTQPPHARTAP
ncbi:type VII secretion protein EccE [Micromonospora sp. NPDC003197]